MSFPLILWFEMGVDLLECLRKSGTNCYSRAMPEFSILGRKISIVYRVDYREGKMLDVYCTVSYDCHGRILDLLRASNNSYIRRRKRRGYREDSAVQARKLEHVYMDWY